MSTNIDNNEGENIPSDILTLIIAAFVSLAPIVLMTSGNLSISLFSFSESIILNAFVVVFSAISMLGVFVSFLFFSELFIVCFEFFKYPVSRFKKKLKYVSANLFFFVSTIGFGGLVVYSMLDNEELANSSTIGLLVGVTFITLVLVFNQFKYNLLPEEYKNIHIHE